MSRKPPYDSVLDRELKVPTEKTGPLVVDLFAGCGGLALGFEAVGFATIGFELDKDCCATYRSNLRTECHETRLEPGCDLPAGPAVIIGGPPCQPFSVNGHQNGHKDNRD